MWGIERQNMGNGIYLADGHQTRIVNLFSDDTGRLHDSLPRRIDGGNIWQKRKRCFEIGDRRIRFGKRHA